MGKFTSTYYFKPVNVKNGFAQKGTFIFPRKMIRKYDDSMKMDQQYQDLIFERYYVRHYPFGLTSSQKKLIRKAKTLGEIDNIVHGKRSNIVVKSRKSTKRKSRKTKGRPKSRKTKRKTKRKSRKSKGRPKSRKTKRKSRKSKGRPKRKSRR